MKNKGSTILKAPARPWLRLVLFLVAVGLAVWGFTTAILNIGSKEVGYQTVSVVADADMPYYALDYQLSYYFDVSGVESKALYNAVQKVYTDALKTAYKLLDEDTQYDGMVNVATLNASQGQALEVDPWLYGVLQDAYAWTLSDDNYSVFAGALHGEWGSILILADPEEFDPEYDDYTAERLAALAEVSSAEHFNLQFINGKVLFEADSVYGDVCERYEVTFPALDLNVMKEALIMDHVVSELEAAGYTEFNLVATNGLCVNRRESATHTFKVYAEDGSYSTLEATGRAVFLQGRAFRVFDSDIICYTIKAKDGSTLHRSRYFDVTTGIQPDTASHEVLETGDGATCVSAMLECLNGFIGGK